MLEASLLAALAGGLLTLLAPCSALLLPAFFAYAFANRTALLRGTLLFLLGVCTVLLPVGLAASAAAQLFVAQRQLTVTVVGAVLIVLGLVHAVGLHSRTPRLPIPRRLSSASGTYATGLVYGLTGFCSGPLLGGVLTLAAMGESPLIAASLLVVYAVGMALPLAALALVWDRLEIGRRSWLRGRGLAVGGLQLHTTNLIGGALFAVLGASFIVSQGGALLSGAYDDLGLSALGFRLQDWLASNL